MKKHRLTALFLVCILLLSALAAPALAADAVQDAPASEAENTAEPFSVDAKAAMLVDLNTNRVIYEQNPDERVYPASLTKIMTCLLVLENGNLSDTVTVTESAFSDIDSSSSVSGLQVGEELTVENLLYCMMLMSGNEASNVAAEYIAGNIPDFVRMMNERAYELGCENTHFCNPHGLHDDEHYTTARDLVKIVQAALKSATFKQITNTAEYAMPATNLSGERTLKTTNQLIWNSTGNAFYYSRAEGIKTGYTSQAGRCVISAARGDGLYLLGVVCGAKTEVADSGDVIMCSFPECIRLFNYGFDSFSYVTALSPLYPVTQIAINNSAGSEYVALAPKDEIRILLPKNYDPALLETKLTLDAGAVDAPVAAGTKYGTAEVLFNGDSYGTTDLVAITDVAKSEIAAAGSQTSAYIQSNWWKWLVVLIVLAILAFIVFLFAMYLRRREARKKHLKQRRRRIDRMENIDRFDDYR